MATAKQASGQIGGLANARYIRVSPQKARLVVDLIRGQRAEEAIQTLRFTKKRVAKEIAGARVGQNEAPAPCLVCFDHDRCVGKCVQEFAERLPRPLHLPPLDSTKLREP